MKSLLAPAVAVAIALAIHPNQSRAQGIARVRCDSAAMTVAGHALPRVGEAEWSNWVALTGCGARGAAVLAGALQSRSVRTERDVARIDVLTGLLDGWYAPQLITTYETVAAADDATAALRLRVMWLLAGLLEPSVDVAGPLQSYTVRTCSAFGRTTSLRDAPSSLPPGASDGVRDALAGVAADKSAPASVRATAQCWGAVVSGNVVADEPRRQNEQPASRYDSTWVCTWCANMRGPSSIAGTADWPYGYGSVVTINQAPAQLGYPYGYDGYGYGLSQAAYETGYYPFGYPLAGGLIVSGPMRPLGPTSGLLGRPIGMAGRGPAHPLPPPAKPKR
jgi:hypothetical protein